MYNFREYVGFLLSKTEEEILKEIYNLLNEQFEVAFDKNFSQNLKKFTVFNHISTVNPFICFDVKSQNENFKIIGINIQYNYIGGQRGDSLINENQIWGLKTTQNNYGNVLIRDENIYDKFLDIFTKVDIDFKADKEFSKRYHVASNEKEKTSFAFNSKIRSFFNEIPKNENFIFEIVENEIIMGNRKPMDQYKTLQIANFLKNKI